MAEVQVAEKKKSEGPEDTGFRHKKKRLGIRIDMTPMVDIAFLLLIFFMVTTVFRRPLAMEVNLPESGATVRVPESNVMTLFVRADDTVFYKEGTGDLHSVSWDELDPLFRESLANNPELIVLVKIDRDARYERMVDMMDTLDDAHMERFSLIPMAPRDVELLEGIK
jgi:biopolymer transport protein ExbD